MTLTTEGDTVWPEGISLMVIETELKVPHQPCFGGDGLISTLEILGKQHMKSPTH